MRTETIKVAQACADESERGTMTFPEVLAHLHDVGIERYHADLLCGRKTYYAADGAWCDVACPVHGRVTHETMSAADVEEAIRASQRGEIDYKTFCVRVSAAGCAGYFVTLVGRRAVYYGRSGESFVERFPD